MASLEVLVNGRFGRIREEVMRVEQEMQARAAWVRGWFTHGRVAEETVEAQVEVPVETGETLRNKRMMEVTGVARRWLKTLEKKGIKTESLPEMWYLENRQQHMVGPGAKFRLDKEGGEVEIGRWRAKVLAAGVEEKSQGVTIKASYGSGLEKMIWWIDLDKRGNPVCFSHNYYAAGQADWLRSRKFTGEKLPEPGIPMPVGLRQRSEKRVTELVR